MTVGQLKNIISVIPDDVEIEEADTWKFMDLPKVSFRGANKLGQEMSEFDNLAVHKVIADMEYKFEIGAIIALLRKLLWAVQNYYNGGRTFMGVQSTLVEGVLEYIIAAMEAELKKEKQEDEK